MSNYEYLEGNILLKESKKNITNAISFKINEKETLALIGQSGSGKTLTALSIMGLLPKNLEFKGDFFKNGTKLSSVDEKDELGKSIVYIPQNGHEFLNPSLKVKTQLKDAKKRANSDKELVSVLEEAGFEKPTEILNLYPFELSGGMAQRVTIALALFSTPDLVIADEATNGLNYEEASIFIDSLNKMFPNACKLVITHDLKVAEMCDSILVLHKGNMIAYGKKDEIIASKHPYLESLRLSRVSMGMKVDKLYKGDNV